MNFFRKLSIELTVFGCGAVVMIYEIIGSRIIAPYIGTSTYTWTSLIGVILAALSLGYWLGGRTADRNPNLAMLASVVFLAGGLIAITVLVKDPILFLIAANGLPLELSAVLAAVLLFAPASVLLGFVTPYAIRLSVLDIEHTGRTVGRLYALSTIGSIGGTFSAGFLLIPFVGSTRTLYLLAVSLFTLSLLMAPLAIKRTNILMIVVLLLAVAGTETRDYLMRSRFDYHDFDTAYNRVQVFETTKNGRPLRALSIDPYIYQSSMFLDNGEPGAEYIDFYHLVRQFNPGFRRSLLIGGAGYGFAKDHLLKYPQATIDVVEIDPGMTALARRHFGLRDDPRLTIIHKDGRVFLNSAASGKYDAVFVDAFSSLFSVPFQLTTIEAVKLIEHTLNENGVALVNIGSAVTGRGSEFLAAETATYRAVFPEVRLFQVNPSKGSAVMQNIIIVAAKRSLDTESEDPKIRKMLANEIRGSDRVTGVLTDDLAPVERFISIAQTEYTAKRSDQ